MRGTLFFYHFIRILFYIKVKLTFRSTYYLFNNYRLIHGHFHRGCRGRNRMVVGLQLPMQSVPITTDVVSLSLDQGEVYNIM
jgi:hypothetical protein